MILMYISKVTVLHAAMEIYMIDMTIAKFSSVQQHLTCTQSYKFTTTIVLVIPITLRS